MKTGYMRDTKNQQNLERREAALLNVGCEQVIVEDFGTPSNELPKLFDYLETVQSGDELVVYDLPSLSRNLSVSVTVRKKLKECGGTLTMLDKPADISTPEHEFFLTIQAAHEELLDAEERAEASLS